MEDLEPGLRRTEIALERLEREADQDDSGWRWVPAALFGPLVVLGPQGMVTLALAVGLFLAITSILFPSRWRRLKGLRLRFRVETLRRQILVARAAKTSDRCSCLADEIELYNHELRGLTARPAVSPFRDSELETLRLRRGELLDSIKNLEASLSGHA